jgi:NAD(P)-dependent dehydrogenase (short-subunit alcohol dehydrogenase family)
MANLRLEGKRALITGTGRGIGHGSPDVFADEGADVASTTSRMALVPSRWPS